MLFSREEALSPTLSQEGLNLTLAIDGKEDSDVMSADIPNAKVRVKDERVIMKVKGDLVEFLEEE